MNEFDMNATLEKLPWYKDLILDNRERMVAEMLVRIQDDELSTQEAYVEALLFWRGIAHTDVKWSRFDMLKDVGEL